MFTTQQNENTVNDMNGGIDLRRQWHMSMLPQNNISQSTNTTTSTHQQHSFSSSQTAASTYCESSDATVTEIYRDYNNNSYRNSDLIPFATVERVLTMTDDEEDMIQVVEEADLEGSDIYHQQQQRTQQQQQLRTHHLAQFIRESYQQNRKRDLRRCTIISILFLPLLITISVGIYFSVLQSESETTTENNLRRCDPKCNPSETCARSMTSISQKNNQDETFSYTCCESIYILDGEQHCLETKGLGELCHSRTHFECQGDLYCEPIGDEINGDYICRESATPISMFEGGSVVSNEAEQKILAEGEECATGNNLECQEGLVCTRKTILTGFGLDTIRVCSLDEESSTHTDDNDNDDDDDVTPSNNFNENIDDGNNNNNNSGSINTNNEVVETDNEPNLLDQLLHNGDTSENSVILPPPSPNNGQITYCDPLQTAEVDNTNPACNKETSDFCAASYHPDENESDDTYQCCRDIYTVDGINYCSKGMSQPCEITMSDSECQEGLYCAVLQTFDGEFRCTSYSSSFYHLLDNAMPSDGVVTSSVGPEGEVGLLQSVMIELSIRKMIKNFLDRFQALSVITSFLSLMKILAFSVFNNAMGFFSPWPSDDNV